MKRSVPLFSCTGDSGISVVYGTPSSGRTSMPEKTSVLKLDSSSQNVSTSSIPPSLSGHHSRTPVSHTGTLVRSRSVSSLKCGNEDKQCGSKFSLTRSVGTGERTPITHFCTPRRSSSSGRMQPDDYSKTKQILLSSKQLPDQQHKTPSKRFFNEGNSQKSSVTPDCYSKVIMETPRNKVEAEELPVLLGEETSNLTVGVRVRPLSVREHNDSSMLNVVSVDGNEVKVMCESGTTHTFTYDHCFWSCDPLHPQFASQDVVFTTMVQPLIDKAFLGYNACLFAYGQTGSGKSYSMMGIDIDVGNAIGEEVGIIPRFCHELFERIASLEDSNVGAENCMSYNANVEISYFEIYNEKIHDLLGGSIDGGKRAALKVREHPVFGPYVVDLSVHGVTSYEDLQGWLMVGNSQRITAATGINEKSSRSHSIFSIILTQTQEETMEGECHKHCRRSKINLVDLAGSERLSHTCASGDRLREGVSINRSLLTLGKVISALADNGNNKKKSFVPYRESILTWLLSESLGGNSRTTMLATISPANIHLDETLATLRYACQARTIVNRVRVNEHPQDRLIRELRAEVERLRTMREDYERQMKLGVPRRLIHQEKIDVNEKENEIEILKKQLKESEEQLKQSEEHLSKAQQSWSERLEEAERCKSVELNHLRRCGVALQLDWKQQPPCLINLAADPSLSGILLYLLTNDVVHIGRLGSNTGEQQPDIALSGLLVQPHHCTIENKDSKLSLIPGSNGETYVNGEIVKGRLGLHHGDRLVIGGNHYFRVSNPYDCFVTNNGQLVDYDFAHQEILRIQEEKLLVELEEAKRQAVKELEETKKEAEKQLGFQRLNYEQQLKQMSTTLEQHKSALADIQKKKDELEMQKNTLQAEVQRKNLIQEAIADFTVMPYKSDFLQEIEAAINETIAESESILKLDTSQLSDNLSYTSLYELTVAVQEANQRCKELGISFKFHQQHIVGESGLEPTVRVRDTEKQLVSFWKPAHFLHWVQQLHEYELNESLKELLDTDVSWEVDNWEENEEDANSTRISVNVSQIKRQLNESIQLSMDTSSYNDSALESLSNNSSTLNNTSATDYILDIEGVNRCLSQMETTANKLTNLCNKWTEQDKVKATIVSLHAIIQELRTTFYTSHDISFSHHSPSQNLHYLLKVNPQRKFFPCPSSSAVPGRSSLRSPCPNGSSRTQKAVRFFLSTSQHDPSTE